MSCDVGEVVSAQVKQWTGCRMSCDVGKVAEGLKNEALPTSQLILQPFQCFTYAIATSPTSQLILQPFCRFTYVTAHSTALPLLHLCHRYFTYFTWRATHAQGDEKKQSVVDQLVTKFRSSYSFGQLLRILLRAVNFIFLQSYSVQ